MVRFARRMRDQTFLLCALIPPGSVEAHVGRVQQTLFSEHGLASAQAVAPLVPIAFLDRAGLAGGFIQQVTPR